MKEIVVDDPCPTPRGRVWCVVCVCACLDLLGYVDDSVPVNGYEEVKGHVEFFGGVSAIMAEQGVVELEKEITCAVCHEHYTEPKVLPCCHYYCKQCILRLVQRIGVDKPFSCPECRKEATLPQGDVDQLQTAFFVNRMKEVHSKLEQVHGKVEAKCEMCSGGKAEAFCRQCTMFICSECIKHHQKLKVFMSHKTISLDELREGGAKEIVMQEPPLQTCKTHEEPMKIFCFDCNSLICRDCTIIDHSGHKYNFVKVAAPEIKKKLIEQLDPLKEIKQSLSQAVKEAKNTKSEIEAQGHSVAEEIESSFEELIKILKKRKQELLKKAALEVTQKLEHLCVQEKSLFTSCVVIESVIEYTEQCVEHSADDEVLCMHVELESRIAREMKEQRKEGRSLEPVEEADIGVEVSCRKELEELCQTKAKIIQYHIDPTKCIVTGEGAKSAEIGKNITFSLTTNLTNGRFTKQKCRIDSHLKSLMTGSIVQCEVNKVKGSEYHVQYTPTVHGDHELIVTVNGEAAAGSPFPVCVSIHPTQLGKPVKTLSGLKGPADVAVNSEGEIIVTERDGDVVMFDREGRRLSSIKQSDHNFVCLNGVADDKEDNIYFIDTQKNYIIYKTNKTMKVIKTKESKYPSNGYVGYVAVVGDEVMLSASNRQTTIEVYNTDLEYVREITPRNISPETVGLRSISSDEHGTLYVSDDNQCIQVLSNDGEFLCSIASKKLSDPDGLCVAGQYVYVVEWGACRISVYTSEGEHVASFGDFSLPRGVCADRHGLVYVCDYCNDRVQIF